MADTLQGQFPSENIPIKDKRENSKYSIQYCKAIFGYGLSDIYGFANRQGAMIRNRSYGAGRQDCTQYQDQLDPLEAKFLQDSETGEWHRGREERSGYPNIKFEPLAIMAQWRDHFVGKFMDKEYEVVASAIDEFAETERNKEKQTLMFHKDNQDLVQAMDAKLGVAMKKPDYIPDTQEELDIYYQLGSIKLDYEIALENVIAFDLAQSDWLHQKHRILGDIFDNNESATIVLKDPDTAMARVERADTADVIMQYDPVNQDYKNSTFAGRRIYIPVARLRLLTGWSEDKVYSLVQGINNNATSGNRIELDAMEYYSAHGFCNYDNLMVTCWYMCWKGYDMDTVGEETVEGTVEVEISHTPRPNEIKSGKVKAKNGGFVKEITKELTKDVLRDQGVINVYDCFWVENTEFVWDIGLMDDQIRIHIKNSELPITKIRLDGASPNERIQPYIDNIHLAWYRLQNAMANAEYEGTAYSEESVKASAAAMKCHPVDLLKNRKRGDGNVVMKFDISDPNERQRYNERPTYPLTGGYANAQNEFNNTYLTMNQLIQATLGMTSVQQTMEQNKGIGVGQVNQMVSQTDINLRPFADGYIKLKNMTANKLATRARNLIIDSDVSYENYAKVIGYDGVDSIRNLKQFGHVNFGITIESKPTEAEKEAILAKLQEISTAGSRNGEIMLPSAFFAVIKMLGGRSGVKQSQRFLSIYEGKMRKEVQAKSEQGMQFQTQMQQATEKQKFDQEVQLINAKGDDERKTLQLKYELEMQLKGSLSKQGFMQDLHSENYMADKNASLQPPQGQEMGMQEQQPIM